MNPIDVFVFAAGVLMVLAVLVAAVRTVAVPRAERVLMVRGVFAVSRVGFRAVATVMGGQRRRDALWARFAPMTLLILPFLWAVGVIAGFTAMFWALGEGSVRRSIVVAGSSFTTLGIRTGDRFVVNLLEVAAALLGLGLIALVISYMPTIYGAFSRREVLVARLETRAGAPPSPEEWIRRAHTIGWLDEMDDTWAQWENWFIELSEAHTSHPALNFFRSPVDGRSWITAAGVVLDTCALFQSTLDVRWSPSAGLCIRAGFTSLRNIATYFGVEFAHDPQPTDPISVDRASFDALYDTLSAEGVPLRPDRDQAWRDFAGWRVNYDQLLAPLCRLVDAQQATLRSAEQEAPLR